ncbi:MAG: hypothetical protein QM775_06385 [Pirellulales bacterium]
MADMARRGFLGTAIAGLSGAAASNLLVDAVPTHAAEPVKRDGRYKFKFSLAAYSYRNFLTSHRGKKPSAPPKESLTLEDFIADCAKFGCDGTELTSYYFPEKPTPEYLRSLKALCFKLGLDVTGTAVGNDFTFPKGSPERAEQIAYTKRWIENAEILGGASHSHLRRRSKEGADAGRNASLGGRGRRRMLRFRRQARRIPRP